MPFRSWQALRLSSCSCGFAGGLAGRAALPREAPDLLPRRQATVAPEEGAWSHVWALWGDWYHRRSDERLPPPTNLHTWSPRWPCSRWAGQAQVTTAWRWSIAPFKLFAPSCCQGADFLDVVGSLVRNSSLSSSSAEEHEEGVEESASAMLALLADDTCPQPVSWVGGLGALLDFFWW